MPRNTSGANPEIRVDGKKLHAFFNKSGAEELVVLNPHVVDGLP